MDIVISELVYATLPSNTSWFLITPHDLPDFDIVLFHFFYKLKMFNACVNTRIYMK